MVFLRALLILAAIGLWAGCVFDVIRSDSRRVQYLHRLIWLALVMLVPAVGSLAWLFLGRPQPLGSKLGSRRAGPPAPDDSPDFLARLDEEIRRRRRADEIRGNQLDGRQIEDEIRKLEEELGKNDPEPPDEDDQG